MTNLEPGVVVVKSTGGMHPDNGVDGEWRTRGPLRVLGSSQFEHTVHRDGAACSCPKHDPGADVGPGANTDSDSVNDVGQSAAGSSWLLYLDADEVLDSAR